MSGTLTIEGDGSIDVTGRGLPGISSQTEFAGSHIGLASASASAFGSVYHPKESGGAGSGWYPSPGGGVVRIRAATLSMVSATSSIRADGGSGTYPYYHEMAGGGGSVWITTSAISGDGSISARGGEGSGSGGGGAVAIEYESSTGTVLSRVDARQSRSGAGAGTVYLRSPADDLGRLVVNSSYLGAPGTALPALGGGIAQGGTSGATIVTSRSEAIPAYFVGHWVEVRRATVPLGTWRVGSTSGADITLEPNGAETIDLRPGDEWQGVYRFDSVTVTQGAKLASADPIRDRLPSITVSSPSAGSAFTAGASIQVQFTTSDDWGVEKVILTLGDSTVEVPGPWPSRGQIVAP